MPIIEHYRKLNLVQEINAEKTADEVICQKMANYVGLLCRHRTNIVLPVYRSLQVYQRSNSQVGHRVLSDFTFKIVRPNCPTKSSQVEVRVSTLR